jgi:hypothetical protein
MPGLVPGIHAVQVARYSKKGLLFCKKEAKNFCECCRALAGKFRDSTDKSFLLLFLEKEDLAPLCPENQKTATSPLA